MIVLDKDIETEGYVVYGLRLSGTTEYRYIGLTRTSMKQRCKEHSIMTRHNKTYAVYKWLRFHAEDEVEMVILTRCAKNDNLLVSLEVFWINHYRGKGYRLLNTTSGGEGVLNLSDEARQRISNAARLRVGPKSSMFGRKYSIEERRLKSSQQKGKPSVGAHIRWHVNRGQAKKDCHFCQMDRVDIHDLRSLR